jgi:hypothetical protein
MTILSKLIHDIDRTIHTRQEEALQRKRFKRCRPRVYHLAEQACQTRDSSTYLQLR